jgi:ankyrin repeat protein
MIERADLKTLDAHPAGLRSLLFVAIERRNFRSATRLIERGVNLDGRDENGETLVVSLVMHETPPESLAAALRRGANSNEVSVNGWPALHIAASRGDMKSVTVLLENGASRNSIDNSKHTALGQALVHGHYEVAKILHQAGVGPTDFDLEKASRYAANKLTVKETHEQGRAQLRYLLGLGLNAKKYDDAGWALIHYAIWAGDIEIAKELLSRGADPKARLGDGRTPLELLFEAKLDVEKSKAMRELLVTATQGENNHVPPAN